MAFQAEDSHIDAAITASIASGISPVSAPELIKWLRLIAKSARKSDTQ